jgi:DNA-binding LacI/PurR family transcriptional regulator
MQRSRVKEATLVADLSAQLRALAQIKGPEARLPTVRDMCVQYGVSRVTISSVLDLLEDEQTIYRVHGSGIYVSPTIHHNIIAMVFDPSARLCELGNSPVWQMLWDALGEEAQRRSARFAEEYRFHVIAPFGARGPALPDQLVQLIRSGRTHAVIAVGLTDAAAEWMLAQGAPMVAFAGKGMWRVEMESRDICRLGVAALAAHGCCRIGLWQPAQTTLTEIVTAFEQALDAHHLSFEPSLIEGISLDLPDALPLYPGSNQKQGYRLAQAVFGDPTRPRPDGLIITDDMLTSGALPVLQALGVRLGMDLHVVSHANKGSVILFGYESLMTLIEFDPVEIAHTMFDLLEEGLVGRLPDEHVIRVQPRLRPLTQHNRT